MTAQVVAALAGDAPRALWEACVHDLDARPFAPWTALAAAARSDAKTLRRCAPALVDSIRRRAPFAGGCGATPIPEIALTALVTEALTQVPGHAAQTAGAEARAFLRRWQYTARTTPAALDPALAVGAFPASPTMPLLRGDITAHAVLALRS